MLPTQIIDPHTLRNFILLHQDFLRPKFPEPKITSKRGRPRIGLRWVVIAICVFAQVNNIVWEELPPKLRHCNFLIEEKYLRKIPCKSTLFKYWDKVSQSNLKSWIRMSGHALGSEKNEDAVIDSSGFELIIGSFWRLVKWGRRAITTSSKIFCKVHIVVALPSRAIIGIETSKSTVHDSVSFGPLWKHMYKRVIRWIRRVHLDKAYWCENIINFLKQESIKPVIPCKSNSKDHGNNSHIDQLVSYQRKMPGLYKINNKTHLRAEVEHVFGEVKLFHILLRSRKRNNKLKALLCSFLWYNHKLMIQEVKLV